MKITGREKGNQEENEKTEVTTIEEGKQGGKKLKKVRETGLRYIVSCLKTDTAKLIGFCCIIAGGLLAAGWIFHWSFTAFSPIGFFPGYILFRKKEKRDFITIIEKPPNRSARLLYADPEFYGSLEHLDEPATLSEPEIEIVEEEEEDGNGEMQMKKKVALKGIETSRQGSKIVVCQDFSPEEGYILHGWIDGQSHFDFIIDKSVLAAQTALIQKLKQKITSEMTNAHNIALREEEKFIEKWSELPSDKVNPRDEIEEYQDKKKALGLGDIDG